MKTREEHMVYVVVDDDIWGGENYVIGSRESIIYSWC